VWFDLIAIALLVALALSGLRGGGVDGALRFLGLPAAYGAAAFASLALGPIVAEAAGLAGWLAALGCGSAAFVATYAGVGVAASRARREAREEGLSRGSQLAGGLFGVARGLLLLLPIVWVANLAEGARLSGVELAMPDLSGAQLPAAGGRVIASGAQALVDEAEPGGRVTVAMLARPGDSVLAFQELLSDPQLRILQGDPGFWRDVERGAVSSAMARPTFQELSRNPALRGRMAQLGLVSAAAASDPRVFEQETGAVLAELGPRLRRVRNDPALERLLADPGVQRSLEQGDAVALLTHPEFRALVARATDPDV
jgi:hypothetical protein